MSKPPSFEIARESYYGLCERNYRRAGSRSAVYVTRGRNCGVSARARARYASSVILARATCARITNREYKIFLLSLFREGGGWEEASEGKHVAGGKAKLRVRRDWTGRSNEFAS